MSQPLTLSPPPAGALFWGAKGKKYTSGGSFKVKDGYFVKCEELGIPIPLDRVIGWEMPIQVGDTVSLRLCPGRCYTVMEIFDAIDCPGVDEKPRSHAKLRTVEGRIATWCVEQLTKKDQDVCAI